MKIYFAGAIRGGRDDAALYHEIVRLLSKHGEVLTEHVADSALGVLGQDIGDRKITIAILSGCEFPITLLPRLQLPASASAMKSARLLSGASRCSASIAQAMDGRSRQ